MANDVVHVGEQLIFFVDYIWEYLAAFWVSPPDEINTAVRESVPYLILFLALVAYIEAASRPFSMLRSTIHEYSKW